MKLVFLDFDGCLNSKAFFRNNSAHKTISSSEIVNLSNNLDPQKVVLINTLVEETKAQIVISSSWRTFMSIDDMNVALKSRGATFTAIGSTPHIINIGKSTRRYYEIKEYLNELKEQPSHFVIIDDSNDEVWDWKDLFPFLVETSFEVGFTEEHLKECVIKLNRIE